jgi:hypothetical protein
MRLIEDLLQVPGHIEGIVVAGRGIGGRNEIRNMAKSVAEPS